MADLLQSRARLSCLDGLRLLAAVQMIQGHTLDALMAAELRHGPLFRAWTFTRGLTSTAFLFTAGVSFALAHAAGRARGERGAGARRRVKRALMLIVLGYALRAPLGMLFGDAPEASVRNLLAVDVLQCIGVSLLVMEALYRVVPSRRQAAALAAVLGTACFALAAAADGLHGTGAWLALTNYLSAADGSLFPLLPAAGHVFWGLALAELTLLTAASDTRRQALGLCASGCVALLVASLLFALLPALPARASPAYAALKLGLVLLICGWLAQLLGRRKMPRLIAQLSGETLFLYVSHVLILYAGHVGLAARIGRTQSLALSLSWALALLLGTSLGALAYGPALRALRARFQRGTPRPQSPLPLG